MEALMKDLTYGFRMIYKRPSFAALIIFILALGIGANTAIFSVINGVLFRPLPYKDANRIVMIWERNLQQGKNQAPASPANFLDWEEQSNAFEYMAAFREWSFNITDRDTPMRVDGAIVSGDFFNTLGTNPSLGHTYGYGDDQSNRARNVVLSYGLWQKRYGASSEVVGRKMMLNGELYNIAGVMPSGFNFPEGAAIWVFSRQVVPESPVSEVADVRTIRDNQYLQVLARLKPGVSLENAQAELDTISAKLGQMYPEADAGWEARIIGLREQIVGDIRSSLLILLGAVGFVLLITCANIANLLIVRASERYREFSIRAALGASRLRLVRQLLTESVVLSFVSGILGLLFAGWGVSLLIARNPYYIPRMEEIGIDYRVLVFVLGISLLTGLIFGLAPALSTLRGDLSERLKETGRSTTAGFSGYQSLLVISEISLALILLIGAGLMARSFMHLITIDPGFKPENVLTMRVSLPKSKYPSKPSQAAFFHQVLDRVKVLPPAQSVGAISRLPMGGGGSTRSFIIPGRPAAEPGREDTANFLVVSPDYFQTMSIPLSGGRSFEETDAEHSPAVAIINETMARSFWPNQNPVGQHLNLSFENPTSREIVGVVKDVRNFGLEAEPKPDVYVPYLQTPWAFMTIVVRTTSTPSSIASAVQSEIAQVDREQPLSDVQSMDKILSDSVGQPRFNMLLLSIFAVVALILACVGIYGVMNYLVTLRTREIGIRLALGAQQIDVVKLVMQRGLFHIITGLAIGLAGAFILTRLLSNLLYGIKATDVSTFLLIPMLLAGVALLACYIPAHRASKIDPIIALRQE